MILSRSRFSGVLIGGQQAWLAEVREGEVGPLLPQCTIRPGSGCQAQRQAFGGRLSQQRLFLDICSFQILARYLRQSAGLIAGKNSGVFGYRSKQDMSL